MKKLLVHVAVALWAGTVCSQATVFDYTFTFGSGDIVSGTLEGSQSGNFVDNVANVTVLFNGTPMSGTVYTARLSQNGITYSAGPIVSFDLENNNLLFANSDFANGDGSGNQFFQSVPGLVNAKFPGSSSIVTDNGFGTWSLIAQPEQPQGVPDAGSTATMLGLAIGALTFVKRKA